MIGTGTGKRQYWWTKQYRPQRVQVQARARGGGVGGRSWVCGWGWSVKVVLGSAFTLKTYLPKGNTERTYVMRTFSRLMSDQMKYAPHGVNICWVGKKVTTPAVILILQRSRLVGPGQWHLVPGNMEQVLHTQKAWHSRVITYCTHTVWFNTQVVPECKCVSRSRELMVISYGHSKERIGQPWSLSNSMRPCTPMGSRMLR